MDDEARATGLDPLPDRESKEQSKGPRRGRRSPYRHPRHDGGGQGAGGQDLSGPSYAALDLGTNNCRLLVARPTRDGFRVIDAFSRIIRLGEGITSSGRLSEPAILRAVDALRVCRAKMKNRGVTRSRLIATEACRAAENGLEFLERIRNEVGIDLEIVDRETEARLAATGCTPLVDPSAAGVILFDIGGGSSELVRLDRFAAEHGGTEGLHLLGTSGTVTTIAGVYLELPRYERRRIDGCWMSDTQVSGVVERLLAMSYEGRVANPCIGAERADLVLAGCAILEAIRRAFPCERLRVADRGLREGMLVQMMREDGVWGDAAAVAP